MISRKTKTRLFVVLLIGHFVLICCFVMKFYIQASEGLGNAVVESSKAIHEIFKEKN